MKHITMAEDAAKELAELVTRAMSAVQEPLAGSEKLIADIYTGRDPMGGRARLLPEQGLPASQVLEATQIGSWRPPQTTANLFLSRSRQVLVSLTPGVPSFRVKARVSGSAHLAEDQNRITRIATDHGHLREAMRKAAFNGLLSPYFAAKLTYKTAKEEPVPYRRLKYEAIEARDCGYEPFHRRFTWHAYDMQVSDLPKEWQPKREGEPALKPWQIVRVTEVYHEGFRHGLSKPVKADRCPMSVFVAEGPQDSGDTGDLDLRRVKVREALGEYVTSVDLPACPLALANFMDPAPGEDVPAAEVLSWIPLMRMIVQTLVQIDREIRTTNTTMLYAKGAFSEDDIQALINAIPGSTTYIAVDTDDTPEGVNATMRPVEQNSVLGEYLAALNTYMGLLDDITGVTSAERGIASNPRKSAAEAVSITSAASRRNQDRLEVMAGMWTRLAQAGFAYQREIFGKSLEVPLDNGVIQELHVPDPATAAFSFDVDPVELGHLSNQGDLQSIMQWLTVTTNTQQAFPQGMPRMTREALRTLGNAMGIEDADIYLDAPTIEFGPEERLIEYLQTQDPIEVFEDDQHDMYIAYYTKVKEKWVGRGDPEESIMALQQTIDMHKAFAARKQEILNPGGGGVVPGVGAGPGELDNQLQAALATGGVPTATPQQLPIG